MNDGTTAQGRPRSMRLGRWLQPRRLATVGVSSLLVGGGLFGVLSHVLPATAASFNVTTTSDFALSPGNATTCSSPCSLRAALQASNNAGGTNTVNVPSGTYDLSSSLGELQIGPIGGMSVTISGAGQASTIIHAVQASTCTPTATSTCFRVFNVDPNVHGGVNVTLSGVTVSGGRTAQFGGAGLISGPITAASPVDNTTVTNSTFTDNVLLSTATTVPGGAISQVYGAVTVSGSTFTNNSAGGGPGGAIDLEDLGGGAPTLSITNSTFSGNIAEDGGAVTFASSLASTSSISGSTFTNNSATSLAGALDSGGPGPTFNVTDSTFTGNSSPDGGAIHVTGGTMNLDYSRIYNNTGTTDSAVDNKSTIHANTDWWGTNTGPGTTVNFTPTNWQVLTVTPAASAILVTHTDTVTADLDHTHTGGTIAPAHHLPDGIPVSFGNGTLGTVSLTSGSLSSGSASTTYTAGSTGGLDHAVSATIDAQTTSTTIEVDQPPHITSANSTTFVAGQSNTFTVTADGYPPPGFTEAGALPSGVTLSSGGVLSGTPAACSGGVYSITITAKNHLTATNLDATDTQTFTLTVNEAPSITSANHTTFTVASAGTFTVTRCGYPAPTVTLTSGSLPSSVTYDSTTHVLSGTPASGTGGQYTLQFTAHNTSGSDAVQTFTLTVDEPASIASANHTTFTVGAAGSFSVTTGGFPHPSLSDGGATLPSGVTFVDNLDGTATLSGTPAAGTGGTYPFTITAHNGIGTDATEGFTLTVDEAASVTSANHTSFTTGSPGTFSVTTRGFPAPSLSDGGATLPSGVTFVDNLDGTATLSGTPAAGTGGTYPITITAHNGIGSDGTQNFTLTVLQAPTFTSADHTTFDVGTPGTFTVTTSGFPTGASMVITETGTLPSGVTFVDNSDGTATLSGTPGATTAGDYPLSLSANNGVAPEGTQSFTLHVLGTPHITSANHTTFVVGSPGSFTVTTTGSPPMTISDGGATLPSGVTFTDNGDGTATLAGTPGAGTAGSYPFTITASNGQPPDATQTFTLTVDQVAAITSAGSTTFTVGTPGTFTVTSTGTPTPSLSKTGVLPSGVTFVDNGDGTATLSGTPGAGTGGTYPLTITAHNGVGSDATQNFTLTVDEAPAISSADHTTFTVGTSGSFNVTTTGFPTPGISDNGSTLPSGVSFTDNGDGTATLSGTPAAGTGGTYPISLTASNGVGSNATQSFTLTVDEAPSITSGNATTFTVGTLGSFDATASGFPTPALSESGALPSGVSFADNGDGTATLSGTPATGSGGTYALTIKASNGVGSDALQSFTLTVDEAPTFTSAASTTFTVGAAGSFSVTTDAFPAPAITETGALPSGVSFVDNGDGTATLSGTPATGTGGVYTLHLKAANGIGTDGTQTFTLTVDEAVSITSANNTTFTVGTAGSFNVTTHGFPTPSLSDGGATLPGGVTFVDNGDGTATLSGTPATGTGGVYHFTITAHNGQTADATQSFTLTVDEAAAITSANHVTFTTGQAGSFTVTTSGFPAPTLSETGGLPSGVTFADNGDGTGTLSGTPGATTGGTYNLTFTAHNGIGTDAVQTFTLTVDQPPAVSSGNSTTFVVGTAGSFNVTTTGFPAPSLSETGTLPSGVTFADNGNGTGTLSGTPAAATGGKYNISFKASNGVGSDATQSFTLTVNEAASITSANSVTFQVNTAGSFTVTTRGFPAPSLSESGALPSGVTFVDNGNGTATLSGTPASGTSGTYPLGLTAHNGIGSDGTQSFTLTVGPAPTTTTVTASTTTPTFGQPVTFTATVAPVAPATGTPGGTVTFAVDGVNQTTVTLSGGQAHWTTSSLQLGAHTISGTYSGQTNTFKPSSGSVNVTVGCATVYTGTIKGGVTISGNSCALVNNAKISGGVTISNGASVAIKSSTINNGISSSGARMLSICGDTTSVGGSITVSGTTGFLLIGSAADDASMPCTANSLGGGVTLSGNSGGFELGGNSVRGAVVVNNNVLSVGTPLDSENAVPEIELNTIKGSLSCSGNNPAPIDDLKPNTVSGGRSGQCGAAGF